MKFTVNQKVSTGPHFRIEPTFIIIALPNVNNTENKSRQNQIKNPENMPLNSKDCLPLCPESRLIRQFTESQIIKELLKHTFQISRRMTTLMILPVDVVHM